MPIYKIQTSEYECVHCGHKWINRVNGTDGSLPKRCAKCKRRYWNGVNQEYDPITPQERGLRVRLYRFEGYDPHKGTGWGGSTSYRPNTLCRRFLELSPRPTIRELHRALTPLGWDVHRYPGYVPYSLQPGHFRYDPKEYEKILKRDTQKRRKVMEQIIQSRNQNK